MSDQKLLEAERKLEEMEKALMKWQTLRADTLDKMIDISEEMLEITIRRKLVPNNKRAARPLP